MRTSRRATLCIPGMLLNFPYPRRRLSSSNIESSAERPSVKLDTSRRTQISQIKFCELYPRILSIYRDNYFTNRDCLYTHATKVYFFNIAKIKCISRILSYLSSTYHISFFIKILNSLEPRNFSEFLKHALSKLQRTCSYKALAYSTLSTSFFHAFCIINAQHFVSHTSCELRTQVRRFDAFHKSYEFHLICARTLGISYATLSRAFISLDS